MNHNIPAKYLNAPDVLGYSDYSHIPDELWHCLNCGLEYNRCAPPFIVDGYDCDAEQLRLETLV